MRKTPGDGLYSGTLSRGCTQCIRGAKMVLFVTGVCDVGCFYCPVSFRRANHDIAYANERIVREDGDIIDEARKMKALGTGITGGDPLIVPERTAHYIRLLKENFGPSHHIHLYTGRPTVSALPLIAEAGLDELRVHPPETTWHRFHGTNFERMIAEGRRLGMRVGIEVPAIPGYEDELSALIESAAAAGAQFANLNELEMSESNAANLRARGFVPANDYSNSVSGSDEMAQRTVRRAFPIPVHYCPSRFKDSVQLRERMKRRASVVRWSGDVVTRDGTLVRAVIENGHPGQSLADLKRRFGIPDRFIRLDSERNRVEMAPWIAEEIAPEAAERIFIVEEYPTAERTEVERREIRRR
jgi:pyruvate formate-lyase activating enzyme-like uncharacterized protein